MHNTAMQRQTAVTVYLKSKQFLLFDFAGKNIVCSNLVDIALFIITRQRLMLMKHLPDVTCERLTKLQWSINKISSTFVQFIG